MYDNLHLGILQYQSGQIEKAIESLEKQKLENDVSENYFYLAQTILLYSLGDNKSSIIHVEKHLQLMKENSFLEI